MTSPADILRAAGITTKSTAKVLKTRMFLQFDWTPEGRFAK